mmetsp:Transcript_37690/g.82579  ORF Transcript_37690/g.82579 Transcript_37690/m.82579 type:complete len:367 (+) Transcript_37690:110-1210(+)|eukprot:CAMPEP_0178507374 /NCGR_PEP_ID=MMETSP0696-20121128/20183_1 /TAXON_ID=265572 /ORGANISM="Extubocellulus spinifer, Strain CCMP396" /LENGTH=366 /DNA_ID=CAMNT_0020136853 /DNA_START=87 /DNA_END=1187 /DNA_ORIENTATION=+
MKFSTALLLVALLETAQVAQSADDNKEQNQLRIGRKLPKKKGKNSCKGKDCEDMVTEACMGKDCDKEKSQKKKKGGDKSGKDKKGGAQGGGEITNFASGGITPSAGAWRPGLSAANGGTSFGGFGTGTGVGQPAILGNGSTPGVQSTNVKVTKIPAANPNPPVINNNNVVPDNDMSNQSMAGTGTGMTTSGSTHNVNTGMNPASSQQQQNMAETGTNPSLNTQPEVITVTNPIGQQQAAGTPAGPTGSTSTVVGALPMGTPSLNPADYPEPWDIAPMGCERANKPDWLWKDKSGTGRFNIEQMYARVPQCLYDEHCETGCCVRFHSGFKICQNPDTMSEQMKKWCSGSCTTSVERSGVTINDEDNV